VKQVILRIRTANRDDAQPTRCGTEREVTPEEEDSILDSVLGPPPEEGEADEMELTTAASLEISDTRYTVRYEESELSGMEGTTTEITFDLREPSLVTVLRSGAFRCALVLERGKYHTGMYETPYFPLEVTTYTYALENRLGEDGGELKLDYRVRVGGISSIRTTLHAHITLPEAER